MGNKILVAYATKAGSTREVAESIGQTLTAAGVAVDVRPVKQVKDVIPYTGIILGSAVRMDKILGDVVDFARKNMRGLTQLPTAYFIVCMTMKDDTPANHDKALGMLKPLREIKEPVSMGLFAGAVDFSKLEQPFRFIFTRTKDKGNNDFTEGDWRDWNAIRTWATELLPIFNRT